MMLQLRPIDRTSETSAKALRKEASARERLQAILDELGADLEQPPSKRASIRRRVQDEEEQAITGNRVRWPRRESAPMQELSYAVALERSGKHRKALDRLYRVVDGLIQSGAVAECDRVLGEVNVREMDTHLLVGLLTITAPNAGRLPNRVNLFARVRTRLEEIAPDRSERLLAGLE